MLDAIVLLILSSCRILLKLVLHSLPWGLGVGLIASGNRSAADDVSTAQFTVGDFIRRRPVVTGGVVAMGEVVSRIMLSFSHSAT
jgi:hypothetical protein